MSSSGTEASGGDLRAAYEALWLMAGAPQELVVDTYWLLVQRILSNAPSDADAQGELDALNRAYALITSSDTPRVEPVQDKPKRGRTPLRHKLLKRGAMRPVARSPWEVLQVQPSAPPEVIDQAYRFWQVRLRNAWYDSTGTQRESLDEAYAALKTSSRTTSPPAAEQPAAPAAPAANAARPIPPAAVPESPKSAEPAVTASPRVRSADEMPATPEPEPRSQGRPATKPPADHDVREPRTTRKAAATPTERGAQQKPAAAAARREQVAAANITALPVAEPDRPAAQRTDAATGQSNAAAAQRTDAATGRSNVAPAPQPDPLAHALRNSPVSKVVHLPVEPAPPAAKAAAPAPATPSRPHIIVENGRVERKPFEIGAEPVHIIVGEGHVEVSSSDSRSLVARVWSLGDQVMFHSVGTEPVCLINGREVTWAVLEDGDTIQVGEDRLRFHYGR